MISCHFAHMNRAIAQRCDPSECRRVIVATGFWALAVWVCLGLISSVAAEGPSFDCAKAGAASEKAICDSEHLAWQDRQLTRLYGDVRTELPKRQAKALVSRQRAWLKGRNRCGGSFECLQKSYADRLVAISSQVVWGSTTGRWTIQRAGVGGGAMFVQHADGALAALFETVATAVPSTPQCVLEFDRAEAAGRGWAWSDRNEPDRHDQPCELTIQDYDEGYNVEGNQACSFYCGMRAVFTGIYLRAAE